MASAALNEFHTELYAQRERGGPATRRGGAVAGGAGVQRNCAAEAVKTEGIENIAFNDFTIGVDTTALVQAENIYEVSDAFSRIEGKHGLKVGGETALGARSIPIRT